MGIIYVQDRLIEIDVRDELEWHEDQFDNVRWTPEKLIASSPFRYDNRPSFFVDLREESEYYGCWNDSGAYEKEWASGNFIKLLAFLRGETKSETEEYLLFSYGEELSEGEVKLPRLKLPETEREKNKTLPESILEKYVKNPINYLCNRNIGKEVQRELGVRYDPQSKAVVIPWRYSDGTLANLKYRKTNSKIFWYEKGGASIRDLLFGIDHVYKNRPKDVVVTEAEIDALSFMTVGVPAVALGNASLSEGKTELLRKMPCENLFVCTDNDKQGDKVRCEIAKGTRGHKRVRHIFIPDYKDANEALTYGVNLKSVVENGRTKTLEIRTGVRL